MYKIQYKMAEIIELIPFLLTLYSDGAEGENGNAPGMRERENTAGIISRGFLVKLCSKIIYMEFTRAD